MSLSVEFLYLSQEDVVAAGGLDMAATVRDVEDVFRLHASGDYALPDKVVLRWDEVSAGEKEQHINTMPAYIGGRFQIAGLKTVASFPRNPFIYGLPRASALIILNDVERGFPLAVMDGTLISAMRTGAVTGVAAKYLARNDITRVGLIGAGVQGRTQLMALQETLPGIQEAFIYDVHRQRAETFAAEMGGLLDVDVRVANSAEETARQAEVLVTATTTTAPVVRNGWLTEGTFYAHISGYECEYAVVSRMDKIVVDDWAQVKHRMAQTVAFMWRDGELRDEDIYGELSEIVSGEKPGRESNWERILLNPVGMGIEDIAVAKRIYQTAKEQGLGQMLRLWERPHWF
ncbi:MAG TPA: ornithine cyclodeaminase [Anaerolineae bacterium]|nr:ornithine cyclodeaminase [Anaerolineae bacterium]